MLLAIDLGNTNIKYGVFDKEKLVASFRVSSRISRTADEYGSVLVGLLAFHYSTCSSDWWQYFFQRRFCRRF